MIGLEEERAPTFKPIDIGRPTTFPIPELAGERYPCGGRLGAARIEDVLSQTSARGAIGRSPKSMANGEAGLRRSSR